MAGVVFTNLTVGAVLVGGALFTSELLGITDFSCGAVAILAATIATFSCVTDLTVVALCVCGAGLALVVYADFSVCTFRVVATLALGTRALKTDESCGAVVVVDTARTSILAADLAI